MPASYSSKIFRRVASLPRGCRALAWLCLVVFALNTRLSPAAETAAAAQVGVAYTSTFAVTGVPKAACSYTVQGLPPGLSVAGATFSSDTNTYGLNAPFGSIVGTPTIAGTFLLTITAWEFANNAGVSRAYDCSILVSPAPGVAPMITTQPVSQIVRAGDAVAFSVATSGTPAPAYQWQKNGVAISGATNASYVIAGAIADDEGAYAVVATNSLGAVTSNSAALTVVVAPSNVIVSIAVD